MSYEHTDFKYNLKIQLENLILNKLDDKLFNHIVNSLRNQEVQNILYYIINRLKKHYIITY